MAWPVKAAARSDGSFSAPVTTSLRFGRTASSEAMLSELVTTVSRGTLTSARPADSLNSCRYRFGSPARKRLISTSERSAGFRLCSWLTPPILPDPAPLPSFVPQVDPWHVCATTITTCGLERAEMCHDLSLRDEGRRFGRTVPVAYTVADAVLDQLGEHGVRVCFGIPGVHNLPFWGLAILCVDDAEVRALLPHVSRPIVTYGLSSDADLVATEVA